MSSDQERVDLLRGARTTLRNNASAYPFSVFITACFGVVDTVVGGRQVLRIFLFVLGATLAFTMIEAVASRAFRDRFRPETSDVVMLGAAMAVVSVSAALGVAYGLSRLVRGAWGWFLAPFAGTTTYVLASSLEMALARHRERHDPPDRER